MLFDSIVAAVLLLLVCGVGLKVCSNTVLMHLHLDVNVRMYVLSRFMRVLQGVE